MASAPVAVAVKLTIPNKEDHLNERNKLNGIYEELGELIDKLRTERVQLERNIKNDITNIQTYTLDFAIEAFIDADREVNNFNKQCQNAKTKIDANNQSLQELLDSITLEITQAEAKKAAEDAAAAVAADEAATLQKAKESLQAYIETLGERLKSINDNNLDDISSQIKDHANTIKQYDTELDTAVSGAGEAISQATRVSIDTFKTDTGKEVTTKTREFNALNGEFDLAKKTIVDGLNAKIQALQDIAGGAKVTAEAINAALDTDKTKPIEDKNLGEIKDRAARLADDFGKKATTEFATRKAEIEGKIEEDKKLFQEKKEITEEFQKIKDIFDSQDFKEKEAAIQENIKNAQAAEKAALDTQLQYLVDKLAKNLNFQIAIGALDTSILSLETEVNKIKDLPTNLQKLQGRSANIQPPPVDIASIQSRLDALNEAKAKYDLLSEAQKARAEELSAEKEAAKSRSPSPKMAQPTPTPAPPSSAPPDSRARNLQEKPILQPADAENSSVPEPKRTPGRRYSIFIPTPVQKKPPTTRVEAAAAADPENTEDAIDPNVLEIFVYEDKNESEASVSTGAGAVAGAGGGAGAGAGVGGGIIQRGGEPPKVAKIIKVKKITPEIKKLFLSFEPPSETLTDEFLVSIEKNKDSIKVVDTLKDIDAEMKEMEKKKEEFIQSGDTSDFFESIGKKVDHKSTIMKLMKWMTTELGKSDKKYENLYEELWRFMDYTDCVIILKKVISNYDIKMRSGAIKQTDKQITNDREPKGLQQILGWTSRSTNTLYDNLLNKISKCEELVKFTGRNKQELRDTGKYSKFIHKRFEGRGYRFMLNWLILVALHVSTTTKTTTNTEDKMKIHTYLLGHCGEFIEKLHNIFIHWMYEIQRNNQSEIDKLFDAKNSDGKNRDEYFNRVTRSINLLDTDDNTTMIHINNMRIYLCGKDKSGQRPIQLVQQSSITKQEDAQAKLRRLLLQRGELLASNKKAGQKRTRKHRRPAPASTPAPATRRHRDHSSSSQKHTRRQRPQRREH